MQRIGNIDTMDIRTPIYTSASHAGPSSEVVPLPYDPDADDEAGFFIPFLGKAVRTAKRGVKQAKRKAKQAERKAKVAERAIYAPGAGPVEVQEAAKRAQAAQAEVARLRAEVERMQRAEAEAKAALVSARAEAKWKREAEQAAKRGQNVRARIERIATRQQTIQDRAAALWPLPVKSAFTLEKERRENAAHLAYLKQLGLAGVRPVPHASDGVDVGALFVDTDGYRRQHGPDAD